MSNTTPLRVPGVGIRSTEAVRTRAEHITRGDLLAGQKPLSPLTLGSAPHNGTGTNASTTKVLNRHFEQDVWVPAEERIGTTVIVGATGRGRTSKLLIPLLARAACEAPAEAGTYVVLDVKSPALPLLLANLWRAQGKPVTVLDPYSPEHSARIEPLWSADLFRIHRFAKILMAHERIYGGYQHPRIEGDCTAEQSAPAERLLTVLMRLVRLLPRGECSLPATLRLVEGGKEAIEGALKRVQMDAAAGSDAEFSQLHADLQALRAACGAAPAAGQKAAVVRQNTADSGRGIEGAESGADLGARGGALGLVATGHVRGQSEDVEHLAAADRLTRAGYEVSRLLASADVGDTAALRTLLGETLGERANEAMHLSAELHGFLALAPEVVGGTLEHVRRCLAPFGDERVATVFSAGEVCLSELLQQPGLVVIGAPLAKKSAGSFTTAALLFSLAAETVEARLDHAEQHRPELLGAARHRPLHFILDESLDFQVPGMERWPEVFPRACASLLLCLPGLQRLDGALGAEQAEAFRQSIHTHFVLQGTWPEDAAFYAERFGRDAHGNLRVRPEDVTHMTVNGETHPGIVLLAREHGEPELIRSPAFYDDKEVRRLIGMVRRRRDGRDAWDAPELHAPLRSAPRAPLFSEVARALCGLTPHHAPVTLGIQGE
jgi:hypothetical protein